jgi:hypothetical protein
MCTNSTSASTSISTHAHAAYASNMNINDDVLVLSIYGNRSMVDCHLVALELTWSRSHVIFQDQSRAFLGRTNSSSRHLLTVDAIEIWSGDGKITKAKEPFGFPGAMVLCLCTNACHTKDGSSFEERAWKSMRKFNRLSARAPIIGWKPSYWAFGQAIYAIFSSNHIRHEKLEESLAIIMTLRVKDGRKNGVLIENHC